MLSKTTLIELQKFLRECDPAYVDALVASMVVYSKELILSESPGVGYSMIEPRLKEEISQINEYYMLQDIRNVIQMAGSAWSYRLEAATSPFVHMSVSPLQNVMESSKGKDDGLPRGYANSFDRILEMAKKDGMNNIEHSDGCQ